MHASFSNPSWQTLLRPNGQLGRLSHQSLELFALLSPWAVSLSSRPFTNIYDCIATASVL